MNYLAFVLGILILLTGCGGGGGGSSSGSNNPESPQPQTLSLGEPVPATTEIEPSAEPSELVFTSRVSGTISPEFLYLDEVDSAGDMVQEAVATMRDDGITPDVVPGDRVYSGSVTISSVDAAEKFYRVRSDMASSEVTSNAGNIWISGCPVRARPSNPQFAVQVTDVDSELYGAEIFSNEVMITVANGVQPDLDTINNLVVNAVSGLNLLTPPDPEEPSSTQNQPLAKVVGCIPALRQYLVEIQNDLSAEGVQQAITALAQTEQIINASANAKLLEMPRVSSTCDQTLGGQDSVECRWYLDHVRAPETWEIAGAGSEQMSVAVIDFGVDCGHSELNCDASRYYEDFIDHGTGVASLISARRGDGTDMVGIAWNTSIQPYSFQARAGSQYKMSELITLSTTNEAVKIINISAATAVDPNNQIRDAICGAIDTGHIVVTSAGNVVAQSEGQALPSCELEAIYPARYNESSFQCPSGKDLRSGLLVVGGIDNSNSLATWNNASRCSNTRYVDLFAPGKDLYMASSGGDYTHKHGTSFATSIASGAAAVLWAARAELSVDEIHDTLVDNASTLSRNGDDVAQNQVYTPDDRMDGKPLLNMYYALGGTDEVPDTEPDAISFPPRQDVDFASQVESDAVVISGIDISTPIRIENGMYSIDGGPFTNVSGAISNGQTLRVRILSASDEDTETTALVSLGDPAMPVEASFTVTTRSRDFTPEDFDFANRVDQEMDAAIFSNTIVISGINEQTEITITGGEYSLDGDVFTSDPGVINPGQEVQLLVNSAATPESTTTATVTIGGVVDIYSVTTEAIDSSPEPFRLGSEGSVELDTVFSSDRITIADINTPVLISVSGGEYSINGGERTQYNGYVQEGDEVRVYLRSSDEEGVDTFATLTVGNYSATYRVSTIDTQLMATLIPIISLLLH